jgi:hypothetical protein
VADVVAAGNLAYRLAIMVAATDRLALLVFRQFRFAAELDAARLGAFPSFTGAGAYQIPLELGQPAEDGPEDTDFPAQANVLDAEGEGWWRFCLGIVLEHGPDGYPKHRFAFFLKIKIEEGHVYTKLLNRSYQDFDVNTDDGKELLFKHMIEMLHIAFRCPPEQGLLHHQFGVFHMSLEHHRYPHTETDASPT